MLKLTIRQQKILDFIGLKGKTSNRFIFDFLEKEDTKVTRMTITRDLKVLEANGFNPLLLHIFLRTILG